MTLFCKEDWKETLNKQQLASFDAIWSLPIHWIDAPNDNRGGWSGVGQIEIMHRDQVTTLFVKKQLNHITRTWRHPIVGELTFKNEFRMFQHLHSHKMAVPTVVFFAERHVPEGRQAILVTEKLFGFQSLDVVNHQSMQLKAKRKLLISVAETISRMHQLGIQHRALYSKHLFVREDDDNFEIAVIDLEKARWMLMPRMQAISDLITLNYRTIKWTKTSRLFFLLSYLKENKLSVFSKRLLRKIVNGTMRKQKYWKQKYAE